MNFSNNSVFCKNTVPERPISPAREFHFNFIILQIYRVQQRLRSSLSIHHSTKRSTKLIGRVPSYGSVARRSSGRTLISISRLDVRLIRLTVVFSIYIAPQLSRIAPSQFLHRENCGSIVHHVRAANTTDTHLMPP